MGLIPQVAIACCDYFLRLEVDPTELGCNCMLRLLSAIGRHYSKGRSHCGIRKSVRLRLATTQVWEEPSMDRETFDGLSGPLVHTDFP